MKSKKEEGRNEERVPNVIIYIYIYIFERIFKRKELAEQRWKRLPIRISFVINYV